jgi:hypothetical protein
MRFRLPSLHPERPAQQPADYRSGAAAQNPAADTPDQTGQAVGIGSIVGIQDMHREPKTGAARERAIAQSGPAPARHRQRQKAECAIAHGYHPLGIDAMAAQAVGADGSDDASLRQIAAEIVVQIIGHGQLPKSLLRAGDGAEAIIYRKVCTASLFHSSYDPWPWGY